MCIDFLLILLNTIPPGKSTLVGNITETSSHISYKDTWGPKASFKLATQPTIFKKFFCFVSVTATHKPQGCLYSP